MPDETVQADTRPALTRRLATILAADVAGYSRMMGVDEEGTVQTLRSHRGVFDALLAQHHGRVFNTAGDMILAEFPSAVEAVRCATEIQAAILTRNERLPPERKMLFRMGINLGDVVVQEGDLLGDGVNVAARLQSVAEPGGICLSGSVYDQIRNKLSLHFKALGDRSFKNIDQPVRTYTVAPESAGEPSVAAPESRRVLRPAVAAVGVVALLSVGLVALLANRQDQRLPRAPPAVPGPAPTAPSLAAEERGREAPIPREPGAMDAQDHASAPVVTASSLPPSRVAPVARAVRGTAPGNGRFDGTYEGSVCNFPKDPSKRNCWPVTLQVRNGSATGNWTLRSLGKKATAHVTITAPSEVKATLDGWKMKDSTPMAGAMTGRVIDGRIEVEGRWSNGIRVDGEWTRSR